MKALIESTRSLMVEGKTFYRLPKKVKNNKLWSIKDELESVWSSVNNGSDYPYDRVADLIKDLRSIQKSAKKFDSSKVKGPDDLPKEFAEDVELTEAIKIKKASGKVKFLLQKIARIAKRKKDHEDTDEPTYELADELGFNADDWDTYEWIYKGNWDIAGIEVNGVRYVI